jgi:hypothetical protein
MAAGSIPIIRNWTGAERLYPSRYVFESVEQAVDLVRQWSDPASRELEQEACREFACRHFHLTEITEQYDSLIARLRSRTEEAVAA